MSFSYQMKQHSSKQVVPITPTHTGEKKLQLLHLKVCELFLFRQLDLKVCELFLFRQIKKAFEAL